MVNDMNQSQVNLTQHDLRGALPEWIRPYLKREEILSVEAAIEDAEKKTSGEIVPIIVRQSFELNWPKRFLTIVLILCFALFAERPLSEWWDSQFILTASWLKFLLVFAIGILILGISAVFANLGMVRRFVTPPRDARRLAGERAELEFYRAGIGATTGSTGILLFLAIEDRQAVVLADKAISSKLSPDAWSEVLNLMLQGLRRGRCAEGLTAAVHRCGEILSAHFPIETDDSNELTNRLIIKG